MHNISGNQIHFANTSWCKYFFSYNYFTCQSRMFQMRLSFATAFTSAYKSSDWTQKTIQIHEVFASIDYSPNSNPVGAQSNSLQRYTKTKHSSSELWVGKEREHLFYYAIQNWEGVWLLAIQSTTVMDIRWKVVDLSVMFLQPGSLKTVRILASPHTGCFFFHWTDRKCPRL